MTENAARLAAPLTFQTLSGNPVVIDTFAPPVTYEVEHIALAQKADLFVIAPATANILAKMAHGIADDMLSTTVLATRAPVLAAPAMNTAMWENAATQANVKLLKDRGVRMIGPAGGLLACGDTGSGKMPSEETLLSHILLHLAKEKDLSGKKLLITAGPTQEAIDPVRFITNHSSGKMGYALAKMAALRGAEVTLVSGPVSLQPFVGVNKIDVVSAADMFDAVTSISSTQDAIIMCSAVADYTPSTYSDQKVKKSDVDLHIPLTRTQDILGYLGAHKRPGQILVGFSMETENLIENSRSKLASKNADIICANSISSSSTGFAVDTNQVTLITPDAVTPLPLCSKEETADLILNHLTTVPEPAEG